MISSRIRIPARTIRVRLSLIYGLVFLVMGFGLLTIGYFVVRHDLLVRPHVLAHLHGVTASPRPEVSRASHALFLAAYQQFVNSELHRLLIEYVAALLGMTALSVAAGWLLAGRALAPLRAITATARRVSGENLGERMALRGPQDELKELADTFDRMLERLDGAFASQRHFVANASHELRTPLAIMRTEVDVALADPDAGAGELREMGEAVRETIDRSEGLIAALLQLARSETVSVAEEVVDMSALAADCVTDWSARARVAGIEILPELGPAIVTGDPALIERLLSNLIDNAIRHNVPGGWLKVTTATNEQGVQVQVSNSGPPVDPDDARTLTEPFRRLSRTTGGFGLGLSIVSAVVVAHRGVLTIAPRAGGGLEIAVTLPASRSELAAAAHRKRRALSRN